MLSLSALSSSPSHAYEQNGEWIGCFWDNCKDNKPRFPSKVFLKMIFLYKNKPFKALLIDIILLSKLREHLRLHTGEKAAACPSCGTNFCTRAKVGNHIKSHKIDVANISLCSISINSVISTEGALRLPTTYDNQSHPNPIHPSQSL